MGGNVRKAYIFRCYIDLRHKGHRPSAGLNFNLIESLISIKIETCHTFNKLNRIDKQATYPKNSQNRGILGGKKG